MTIETTLFMDGSKGVVSRHLDFPNWRVWDKQMSHVGGIARACYAEITKGGRCKRFAYDCPETGSWVEGSPSRTASTVEQRPNWVTPQHND